MAAPLQPFGGLGPAAWARQQKRARSPILSLDPDMDPGVPSKRVVSEVRGAAWLPALEAQGPCRRVARMGHMPDPVQSGQPAHPAW
jgi:hypothetical protein